MIVRPKEKKVRRTESVINSVCHCLSRTGNRQLWRLRFDKKKWSLPASVFFSLMFMLHELVSVCVGGEEESWDSSQSKLFSFCFLQTLLITLPPQMLLLILLLTFLLLPTSLSLSLVGLKAILPHCRTQQIFSCSGSSSRGNWSHASLHCRLRIEKFHYSLSHVSGEMFKREERGSL